MYGRYDDLREQEFQLYGNYNLPFGRNQQFLSSVPNWANYLISGYQLSPSLNWSSGLPFSPSYGECGSDIPNGPCTAQQGGRHLCRRISLLSAPHPTRGRTSCPTLLLAQTARLPDRSPGPTSIHSAMLRRNSYTGPSFFNTDLAALKNTPIHENISAQFRMDAFNVFNHINPGNPGNSCIDCTWRRDHYRDGNRGIAASTGVLSDVYFLIVAHR